MVIRGAPFAATGRSYGDHCSHVGAVIGRESDCAVYQVIRGVPFAAIGRSYGDHCSHVGAVIGREWAARCVR